MMELLSDVVIRCKRCGKIIRIDKDRVDAEVSSCDHGENGMGDEIEYTITEDANCPYCSNRICYRISGSEYPVDAFNHESCEIDGGEFAEEPHMGVIYFLDAFGTVLARREYDRIQRLIIEAANDKGMLYKISPRDFEKVVESIFKDEGFETQLTQETHDGGKDIIATKYIMGKPVVFYIECKKNRVDRTIGLEIVRALLGVQTSDRVNKTLIVTTSHFSRDAKCFAEKQNVLIGLIDIDEFHEHLKKSAEKYFQEQNNGLD